MQIRNQNFDVQIVIEHDGIILKESNIVKIDASYQQPSKVHQIDFSAVLPYESEDIAIINRLVSVPILSN